MLHSIYCRNSKDVKMADLAQNLSPCVMGVEVVLMTKVSRGESVTGAVTEGRVTHV